MAAIRVPNVVENDPVKGTWASSNSSSRANTPSSSLRRPSNANTRTPLSNGSANGIYHHPKSAQIPESSRMASNGESDDLQKLYDGPVATNSSFPLARGEDQIPENMYRPEDYEPDFEKWIHRDKLAKIENEELQAAGFQLAKHSTSKSGRRAQSRDRQAHDSSRADQSDHLAQGREEKRSRVSSPVEEETEDFENKGWDLRTAEEIAAASRGGTPVVRKNGSKIPVLTSSPLPIPSVRLDRDTPLPRKRTFSGSIEDDETPAHSRSRTRGNSVGSQNLMDEVESNNDTPTSYGSISARPGTKSAGATPPMNVKIGSKAAAPPTSPPSATRKATPAGSRKTSNTHKPRVPSNSTNASPPQNPPNRSSDPDRPRTAVNRPEGEAPWLATMYKPDPRLPQDQQIIPTHAKKQLQEQPQSSDEDNPAPRDYRHSRSSLTHPNSEENPTYKQPITSPPAAGLEKSDEPNSWPLKPMTRDRSASTSRPGTSGSAVGAYSTMPKVANSPLNSPPIGGSGSIPAGPQSSNIPQNLPQSPPPGELDKKKNRGCGCCVMM